MDSLEYRKTIPVYGEYDVIVAGAGAAGICAAVAAARQGARVCLVERYGVLGGNLTVGFVGPILGMVSKGTMRDELMALLGVPENDMLGWIGVAHDFEKAKRVIADFVDIDNLTVLMQSPAVDVIKEGNRVKGLLISGNDGLKAIYGKVVIDSTGDGDISFLAGAETMKGRSDGLCQPVSLEFTIGNVDESRAVVCIGDVDDVKLGDEPFLEYCRRCAENGELPPELAAVRLHRTVTPGQRQVNTTQLNRIDGTDTASLFRAEAALRRQIGIITDFLRSHLPGYEDCRVISSGATLGVRESRRVRGEYILTREDGMLPCTRLSSSLIYIIQRGLGRLRRRYSTARLMISRTGALSRLASMGSLRQDAAYPEPMMPMLPIGSCQYAWPWVRLQAWPLRLLQSRMRFPVILMSPSFSRG